MPYELSHLPSTENSSYKIKGELQTLNPQPLPLLGFQGCAPSTCHALVQVFPFSWDYFFSLQKSFGLSKLTKLKILINMLHFKASRE